MSLITGPKPKPAGRFPEASKGVQIDTDIDRPLARTGWLVGFSLAKRFGFADWTTELPHEIGEDSRRGKQLQDEPELEDPDVGQRDVHELQSGVNRAEGHGDRPTDPGCPNGRIRMAVDEGIDPDAKHEADSAKPGGHPDVVGYEKIGIRANARKTMEKAWQMMVFTRQR
ncbi:MAG: hypothetical protein ACR2ME_10800 [Acidimicrobiia bacterium]